MSDPVTTDAGASAPAELPGLLEAFLNRRMPSAGPISVSDCRPLSGGYSRLMTRFTATIGGHDRTMVLRADAPGSTAPIETDRVREWTLLDALTRAGGAPMPDALFADTDGHELGSKAIVLDFAPGGPFLSSVRASDPARRSEHARAVCDLAADIQAIDAAALPAQIERPTSWSNYIDELIGLWRATEAELSESIPMLRYVAAWLERNRPPEAPMCLVHGEFQPGNMMIGEDGRLLAVDWEFAHIGDPREDLGWITYVEAIQPPALFGADPGGFCAHYRRRTGLTEQVVNPLTVAYFSILPAIRVFAGLLRTQQSYVDGHNTDLRTAFLFNADITAFEGWFAATRQLEAAQSGAPA